MVFVFRALLLTASAV